MLATAASTVAILPLLKICSYDYMIMYCFRKQFSLYLYPYFRRKCAHRYKISLSNV